MHGAYDAMNAGCPDRRSVRRYRTTGTADGPDTPAALNEPIDAENRPMSCLPRALRPLPFLSTLLVAVPADGARAQSQEDMWSHFEAAAVAQAAVIRGDLDALVEPARWLAEHEEPELPDGTEAFVRELKRAATRAAEARTIEEAGAAMGRIAAACGSCHREYRPGMEPAARAEPPVAAATDVGTHMVRHVWAANRLWEGLVLPSNEAWEEGADVFADDPIDTDALTFDDPEAVHALVVRTHELGRRAGLETEPSLRARTYGELLSTCAACHLMTGQEPVIEKLDW